MTTLAAIISFLNEGNWFAYLNLKDAYFHLVIHQAHRRFLRFTALSIQTALLQPLDDPEGFTKVLFMVHCITPDRAAQFFPTWTTGFTQDGYLRKYKLQSPLHSTTFKCCDFR